MKCRRRFIKVIGLLAAGAAINVVVAWGLATWGPPIATQSKMESGWRTDLEPWWREIAPREFGPFPLRMGWLRSFGFDGVVTDATRGPAQSPSRRVERRRYGWPALTAEVICWGGLPASGQHHWRTDGVELQLPTMFDFGQVADSNVRLLPRRPLWSGFAINMLFYTGVLWLIFFAPFALRRMIRRQRNRCPACAYPVGSSDVCTECGNGLSSRSDARM